MISFTVKLVSYGQKRTIWDRLLLCKALCRKHGSDVFIDKRRYYCLQCFLENEDYNKEFKELTGRE